MTGQRARVVIVGAGPAGLFAAERLAEAGCAVTVLDRMASPARKFLLAGRGGLNLTHSEPRTAFLARYGEAADRLRPFLDAFPPAALRAWAEGLGQPTFVGSSGRVFPEAFKASPLLRAWLARLGAHGVQFAMRRRLVGIGPERMLTIEGPDGPETIPYDAALLALGGASWPRMGSDGAWVDMLGRAGIAVAPLMPANMGVEIGWTGDFADRFAGEPLKGIVIAAAGRSAQGEAIVTAGGLEGGVVYALSAVLRETVRRDGAAELTVDLKPGLAMEAIAARLASVRPKDSLSSALKKKLGLGAPAVGLLRQATTAVPREAEALAGLIKAVPLVVRGVRPLERAISSAGGIRFSEVDENLQLRGLPGLFVAGEMLDWEAPTGGYLLQASFATAEAAAGGMARHLGRKLGPLAPTGW